MLHVHVSKRCICLHLPKNLSFIFQFPAYIYIYISVCLQPFDDLCFDLRRLFLGKLTFKNRGHLGSRYIYIYISKLPWDLDYCSEDKTCTLEDTKNFDRFTIFLIVAIYSSVNTVLLGIITYSLTLELSWLAVILPAMLGEFSHLFVAVSRSSELTSSWWIKAWLIAWQLTKHGKGWNYSTCVITHLLPR